MFTEGPKLWFGPGRLVDAYNFTRQQLEPYWIGIGLSRIARFSGNGTRSVNVAQHSRNLSLAVGDDLDLQRAALMHDVPELFTGDVPSPVKRLCPDLMEIDRRIIARISKVYQIPLAAFEAIHEADGRIAETEKLFMFDDLPREVRARAAERQLCFPVQDWPPSKSADAWTARFCELFDLETH